MLVCTFHLELMCTLSSKARICMCVWVGVCERINAFISIREIFYKFMCSAVCLQQTCAIHMNSFPFPRKKERKKLSLRYDDANTRKIVMATVEFIYITSNTFILQSYFYTHMYVTHRISGLYAALVAAVAMAVTAVQLFYIQMHTYITPRGSLCVLTSTQSNIALWISKKCAWKEIHQAFTQKYRMCNVSMCGVQAPWNVLSAFFAFSFRLLEYIYARECRMNGCFSIFLSFHLKHLFANLLAVFLC